MRNPTHRRPTSPKSAKQISAKSACLFRLRLAHLSLDVSQFHVCGTGLDAGLHLKSGSRLVVQQNDAWAGFDPRILFQPRR